MSKPIRIQQFVTWWFGSRGIRGEASFHNKMAEFNIALPKQMMMNGILNFLILLVEDLSITTSKREWWLTVLLTLCPWHRQLPHWRQNSKQDSASCSLSSFTNRWYSPFNSRSWYTFRIQNLLMHFCSHIWRLRSSKVSNNLTFKKSKYLRLKVAAIFQSNFEPINYQTKIDRDNRWCSGKYKRA